MKLSNCPFCGSEAMPYEMCEPQSCSNNDCNAVGPDDPKAWNARPFEEHAVEVLAKQLFSQSWCNVSWEHCDDYGGQDKYRAQARELLGIKE